MLPIQVSMDKMTIEFKDVNMEFFKHEIIDDTIKIGVKSNKLEVACTYCNTQTSKVHSRYNRSFQDVPLQGKKVVIIIN